MTRAQLTKRRIGDLEVSPVGMGAMSMTATPEVDPVRAREAVHAAIEAGITLFDTADVYGASLGMGVNERALREAIASYPGDTEGVIIATKGGHLRGQSAALSTDGSPEYLARAARQSLERLELDALPLYQLHSPDPRVPFAESLGGLRELIEEGLVLRAGVSNVDVEQLNIAHEVLGEHLVSVQNQYSGLIRYSESVLRRCEELGIAFLAWGPLGGRRGAKHFGQEAPAFAQVARERGVSPQQVGVAWLLAHSPVLIPIPGASRPESIRDTAGALDLELSAEEMERLDAQTEGE